MCSIMGYCSENADYDLFKEGFDRTSPAALTTQKLLILALADRFPPPCYYGPDRRRHAAVYV